MLSLPPTESPVAADFVCGCDASARSACKGLEEHERTGYCVLHYRGKEKSAPFKIALKRKLESEDFDFGEVWFPDNVNFQRVFTKPVDFGRATFNARANFDNATFNAKASFNHTTFSTEANFQAAKFNARADFYFAKFNPEANANARAIFRAAVFGAATSFKGAIFGMEADFRDAIFKAVVDFSAAEFKAGANFPSTKFNAKANFPSAKFGAEAHFNSATFGGIGNFYAVTFRAEADFSLATFNSEADFKSSSFSAGARFRFTTFKDYASFLGSGERQLFDDESSLNLQFARIEKSTRFSFHTVALRPHWFANVDARAFDFFNVNWQDIKVEHEINALGRTKDLSANRLLAVACRNLAVNAEENHRYEEASRFRYMAMEARRLERWRGFAFWQLDWWYWVASGYGERMGRALLVLLGILALFATLYTRLDSTNWEMKAASEKTNALLYSANVMMLQKPEPRPATNAGQSLVMIETILGPVQAALLALAIRRKFMR